MPNGRLFLDNSIDKRPVLHLPLHPLHRSYSCNPSLVSLKIRYNFFQERQALARQGVARIEEEVSRLTFQKRGNFRQGRRNENRDTRFRVNRRKGNEERAIPRFFRVVYETCFAPRYKAMLRFQELRRQCQDFATALLDHTRSSYELEVLLNHDPTGPAFEHGERMHLNRLKLAIKLRQKKVTASIPSIRIPRTYRER